MDYLNTVRKVQIRPGASFAGDIAGDHTVVELSEVIADYVVNFLRIGRYV